MGRLTISSLAIAGFLTITGFLTALDDEALALLRRAEPFPPPPPELAGARVDLTVPIRFNLR
jgi:periplasmic protein TonB